MQTEEYKHRRDVFNEKAKQLTKQHAFQCIETNKGAEKEARKRLENVGMKSCESDRTRPDFEEINENSENNLSSQNQDSPTVPKSKRSKAEVNAA